MLLDRYVLEENILADGTMSWVPRKRDNEQIVVGVEQFSGGF